MFCAHCNDPIDENGEYYECRTCGDYYCDECGPDNCPSLHLDDADVDEMVE